MRDMDRERRRLANEANILLGRNNPVTKPMYELQVAASAAGDGLESWRADEFVRVLEARRANPDRTELDEVLDEFDNDEGRHSRELRVGSRRMPVFTAAVVLSRVLVEVAQPGWAPSLTPTSRSSPVEPA